MATAILETLEARSTLIAEAGTGTGKTLAYLVPSVLSSQKIIISTATKTLQDQLFRKDLPLLRRALDLPFRASLLKGRSNYLCLYRLKHHLGLQAGHDSRDAVIIERIRRWSKTTLTGDIAELSEVPEESVHWQGATSTIDNCLGSDCPDNADCHLLKARARARESDIIVVNHHLLWADWTLRNDGQGELLPSADGVVVDEAHQFLESAAQFLGTSIRSGQMLELSKDIGIERIREAPEAAFLQEEARRLERLVEDLRLALGPELRREPWETVASQAPLNDAMDALTEQLKRLSECLLPLTVRGKGLEACEARCSRLLGQITSFLVKGESNKIQWFETRKAGFTLNESPLTIDSEFREFQDRQKMAWIFTSATLTHRNRFDHFITELGLIDPRTEIWQSPFNYPKNARLYIPTNLPDPNDFSHTERIIEEAAPLIKSSKGRAFLLFTSHAALKRAAARLPDVLPYPLFVQGTQSKIRLLESFKTAQNGVLLGTATFWEGVDVPGPALSLVIIDKLPFASPSDPVLSAKMDHLKGQGLNPFLHYQLPKATLALKQGVGRLIRGVSDRGVIMICDPRILEKNYGKSMIESLPDITLTRCLDEVTQFLEYSHDGHETP